MSTDDMLALAIAWQETGHIRTMDAVFVDFIHYHDNKASPLVLLAVAVVSNYFGKGHIGVSLKALLENPDTALPPPPQGLPPLGDRKTPADLLKKINLDEWRKALMDSSFFGKPEEYEPDTLPSSYENKYPLVLDNDYVYLARNWINEQWVASTIGKRANTHTQETGDIKGKLDELFKVRREDTGHTPNWQKIACALATRGRILILTGGPGTGKTYTIVRLLALLHGITPEKEQLRILLAAPTGKAAARLTESIALSIESLDKTIQNRLPAKAVTLHQLLGANPHTNVYRHNQDNPIHADVVVVDEASMIDLDMMASLLRALPDTTRLILVGDKDQLASVEAGSVMGDLCAHLQYSHYTEATRDWIKDNTGETLPIPAHKTRETDNALAQQTVQLVNSMRFGENSGIGQLAQAINAGDTGCIEAVLNNTKFEDLYWQLIKPSDLKYMKEVSHGFHAYLNAIKTERPTSPVGTQSTDNWCRNILKSFSGYQVLCAVRKGETGVNQINEAIAKNLHKDKLIEASEGWYEGRPVMMTRNDYELGIMNGDVGITLNLPRENGHHALKVIFQNADGSIKTLSPSRLTSVETVYAMTIHKSQGSEFGHVVLILPESTNNPIATRELLYTGVTRAKQKLSVYAYSIKDITGMVMNRIQRSGRLAILLNSIPD